MSTTPIILRRGQYVRATKLAGKIGAPIAEGEHFEGPLQLDLSVGEGIYLAGPGTHYLATTPVQSIEQHGTYVYALTANSTYRLEPCESYIDRMNRAIREKPVTL